MWDATPGAATPGRETPGHGDKSTSRRNRWDETPKTERETPGHNSGWAETPRTDRTGADLIQVKILFYTLLVFDKTTSIIFRKLLLQEHQNADPDGMKLLQQRQHQQ